MLLYLDQYTFCDSFNEICETVKLVFKDHIQMVFVYRTDTIKGCCHFRDIINQTPDELLEYPINLYKGNIVIDIYSIKAYAKVSLRLILDKMGTIRFNITFEIQ